MNRLARIAKRDWIGLALVLAGFLLRLRQYLANRSLWLDEAMLANNILARDFAGLFRPLDNDQGAPIGFLLLQKTITLLLGDSEYALRLAPFLAGCLALVLMFLLSRKISSAFASNLTLALFAFSPALIYYASEVKQYSSDVAVALGLYLLFVRQSRETLDSAKDAALLALAGALVLWFSHPALFIVGALGLALFIQSLREKDKRRIAALLFIALVWSLSLAALYFVNLRQLSTHQFFLDFWREGFMPRDTYALAWLVNSLRAPFFDLLGLQIPYIIPASLFLVGMIGLTRRLPRFGLFLLLILFLALLASFLTLYPFAGRMILFLAPAFTLLLAEGADLAGFIGRTLGREFSTNNSPRPQRTLRKPVASSAILAWAIRLALAATLLFDPLSLAAENFAAPKMPEHIRPAMQALQEEWEEGDLIYVYHWAEPAVRFYAPHFGFAVSHFILGADHHQNPEAYHAELDSLRGHERVWVLFSHVYEADGFNERDYILNYLDMVGQMRQQIRRPGMTVFLYLYDLR